MRRRSLQGKEATAVTPACFRKRRRLIVWRSVLLINTSYALDTDVNSPVSCGAKSRPIGLFSKVTNSAWR